MRIAFLALVGLFPVLAACGEAGPSAADAPPARLAGVDLGQPVRVLGVEPFWGVEVGPDGLLYSGVDRPEEAAANPGPQIVGSTAVITTRTERDRPLVVTLIATDCSDGMSDRIYPLTARVEIGDEVLQGCAASTEALERAGESGRVE